MEFDACVGEYRTLLQIANFTLWTSVAAATLITGLSVGERIFAMRKKAAAGAKLGYAEGAATLFDSLKGLVAALAAAPPWFAIFLAGTLLLWCARSFTPSECSKQSVATTVNPSHP